MQTDAIWQILPESIKEALKKGGISLDSFEEIRIRTQRPVSVRRKMNLFYLNQNGSLTKRCCQKCHSLLCQRQRWSRFY